MGTKPGDKDIWLNESAPKGHGRFTARITPGGDRLFYFRYTDSAGKRIRLPIGAYDRDGTTGLTLKTARHRAREMADLYLSGIIDLREHLEAQLTTRKAIQDAELARIRDEQAAVAAEAARHAARKSVRDAFDYWEEIKLSKRKNGGGSVRRMFEADVLPVMGKKCIADVTRGDVMEVIDRVQKRGANEMARETYTCLRQLFRFVHTREWINSDPTALLIKKDLFGKKEERDRVLTEHEIKLLAQQLPAAGLLKTTEIAVWIALSTCCRIGNLMTAKWHDINFGEKTWFMPDTKNGRPFTVHLSEFTITQFRLLETINGSSPWCYPNRSGTNHVSEKSATKQIVDRQLVGDKKPMTNRTQNVGALSLPGGKWTMHDLRRTGASMMTKLGVLDVVAEKCLAHTEENKVKRTYLRHDYKEEMGDAWRLLGERLELLRL
jgi:integrase